MCHITRTSTAAAITIKLVGLRRQKIRDIIGEKMKHDFFAVITLLIYTYLFDCKKNEG